MSLAKRSLTASSLLHLAAITGLVAWAATKDTDRPRFAGESEAIELVVSRAEPTWSPEPVTFESAAEDEIRVTVEPTAVQIARKHFEPVNASEFSFDTIVEELLPESSQAEIELAERARLDATISMTETPPPRAIVVPRQPPEPREFQAAVVPPARAVGTDRVAPRFTTSPPPNYPSVAIENRWEGTVLLRVSIDADGEVAEVEVARTSGHPVLDGAAVNAVRRWHGSPATQNDRAVATTELLPVRFKLRD